MTAKAETHSGVVSGKPGRLALPVEGSLRDGLDAFNSILVHASEQDVHANPTTALHAFRKSVRRARALMLLMEGFVGVDAHRTLTATLRTAHRATSDLRDRQVVAGVLQGAQVAQDAAGAQAAQQAAQDAAGAQAVQDAAGAQAAQDAAGAQAADEPAGDDVLAQARSLGAGAGADVPPPDLDEIADALQRGRERLADLPGMLAGTMPARIQWASVTEGLAHSFRRARRRLRAVEQLGDDDTVHGLRKRIKELNYQVELLTAHGGKRVRRRRKQLDRLAEELGQLVDLFVLRDHTIQHIAPDADHEQLLAAIADARATQLAQVVAHAHDVLDDSPRSYARRIVRAARRRRA